MCLAKGFMITAEYLPGSQNQLADALSRRNPESSDWQLNPQIFRAIDSRWGPCTIDLFASRTNCQLARYVSWKADPQAVATDAFLFPWQEERAYAFPPFCLVGRCLSQTQKQKATLVLIAPVWSGQPWYAQLLTMAIALPILIPQSHDMLRSPTGRSHPLLETGSLQLAAWLISGDAAKQQAFQRRHWPSSRNLGEEVRGLCTTAPGKHGAAGVLNGRMIHFTPLWQPC